METTRIIGGNGKTGEGVLAGPRLLTFADAEHVGFFVELFRGLTDGHNAHVTGDVERVLGRRPRDFRDHARAAAAAGAWR